MCPIILELCLIPGSPYYSQNYASIIYLSLHTDLHSSIPTPHCLVTASSIKTELDLRSCIINDHALPPPIRLVNCDHFLQQGCLTDLNYNLDAS